MKHWDDDPYDYDDSSREPTYDALRAESMRNHAFRVRLEAAVLSTHLRIVAEVLRSGDEPPAETMREVFVAAAALFRRRVEARKPSTQIPDFEDNYYAQWFAREAETLEERHEATFGRGDYHTIKTLDHEQFNELLDLLDGAAADLLTLATPTTKGIE